MQAYEAYTATYALHGTGPKLLACRPIRAISGCSRLPHGLHSYDILLRAFTSP